VFDGRYEIKTKAPASFPALAVSAARPAAALLYQQTSWLYRTTDIYQPCHFFLARTRRCRQKRANHRTSKRRRTNRRINHGTGFLISVSCKVKASAGGSVVTHSSDKFASGLKHCRFSNAFSVSVSVYTVVGLLDLSEI